MLGEHYGMGFGSGFMVLSWVLLLVGIFWGIKYVSGYGGKQNRQSVRPQWIYCKSATRMVRSIGKNSGKNEKS